MIALRPLSELDPAVVAQQLAEATTRIQEDNPTLDLRQGVFFQLLVYYHALLAAQRQANIDDYVVNRSLKAMEENPEAADPDSVDDVLSNFNVVRKPGERAAGPVTIVLTSNTRVVIGIGTVFEARGKQFTADLTYSARTESAQVLDEGDRLLTPTADGNWSFQIEVTAVEEGPDSRLRKDTTVIPVALPNGYLTSYATSDFDGGRSAETNAELLGRFRLGVAAKCMAGRTQMQAMLREIEAFSRVVAMSIVGMGDAEMHRDRHTIWPISLGGRVDWYVRADAQVTRTALTKTATLIQKTDDDLGVWQFELGRDDAPGLYEVTAIRPKDATDAAAGGFAILLDARGTDLTNYTAAELPDIVTTVEAAYSRFATAVVRFADTVTRVSALAVGATAEYTLEARHVPLVAAIQDRVMSRGVRHHGADCLVRAPVPCFVTVHVGIAKQADAAAPDTAAIAAAVAAVVNAVGFTGRLYGARVTEAVQALLADATSVASLDLHGRIRYPDGTPVFLRDPEVLVIPDDPANWVTARTVAFFCDPEDVFVNVRAEVPGDL